MEKLLEKLIAEDFEDVFKPADKEELDVRKQELLASLDDMSFLDLRDEALDVLQTVHYSKIEKLYSEWIDVDMIDELREMIDVMQERTLKDFIRDALED